MDEVNDCAHLVVVGHYALRHYAQSGLRLWACQDCRLRFYPACSVCVTEGHRGEAHPTDSLTDYGTLDQPTPPDSSGSTRDQS